MAKHSVAGTYVGMILEFATLLGIDRARLLEGMGVEESLWTDPDARLPARRYDDLFARLVALCGFSHFGLRCGQLVRPGHYGVVGYVVMNCATFGEALRQAERYQSIVGDVGHSSYALVGDQVRIQWVPNISPVHPQMVEQHVTAIVSYAWWLTGARKPPTSVHFTHTTLEDTAEHARFFGCPVLFGSTFNGLEFPASYADIPIPQPDPAMRELMTRHAETLLARLSTRSQFLDEVKARLAVMLAEGPPVLDTTAQAFHMQPRAFQRRLQDEGVSFKGLVDEVRRELALHYMTDRSIALPEIAFMLGFSEQAVFQRAFKRWTGATPGRYRRDAIRAA